MNLILIEKHTGSLSDLAEWLISRKKNARAVISALKKNNNNTSKNIGR